MKIKSLLYLLGSDEELRSNPPACMAGPEQDLRSKRAGRHNRFCLQTEPAGVQAL